MTTTTRWLAATALACTLAPALAGDAGYYVQASAGRTTYDFDCGWYSCQGARGNTVKLGGGYRFGVFALEVWGTDWGRGPVRDYYGDDFVRLRSLGLSGAWRMHFGTVAEGVLRAGFAHTQQTRSVENFARVEGTFGLGLSFEFLPKLAVELGWDLTTSTGGSDRIGSVLAQATTLGLRVRF
jgi:opacity protein-like surface antigen